MTSLAIVVEGRTDALVLRRLLAHQVELPRFFVAGGRASVATVGRNILFHEDANVLIVADADSDSLADVKSKREVFLETLRSIAPADRADVFLFVPELESIVFETSAFVDASPELAGVHGGPFDSKLVAPRAILKSALRERPLEPWLSSFPEKVWEKARRGNQAAAFIELAVRLGSPRG